MTAATYGPPLIGLPGRRKLGHQVDGFGGTLKTLAIDVYLADYSRGIINAGGIPVNIPMDLSPTALLPHLDGILLSGGADIHPSFWSHNNVDVTETQVDEGHFEPERDELETSLLHGALDRQLPVVGICRGLQLLNVLRGGTLHPDVPVHSQYDRPLHEAAHEVVFDDGSELRQLYGAAMGVNSLHHQTVDKLGDGLTVTARADDGTVEGLEMLGLDVIAVQWHPEMITVDDPIFGWLVDRATAARDTRRTRSTPSQ